MNKILFWQSSVLKRCLFDSFDSVIVLGDMYLLSNWLIALICKIKRKKVIFWSHGLYGNEGLLKKVFRLVFYKLADYHLVYEKRGKKLLINNGFKEDKIKSVNIIIDSLPDRCKQIFLMSKIEGLKYKEISHNLRISVKTVEVQISKALKILRSKLVTFLLFLPDYIYDILNF